MSKQQGGEGKGTSKEIQSSEKQDQIRRATKAGRNRHTKGTVSVEHFSGTRLDAPGAIAARRKAAYDKARKEQWRKQREEAILRDRKNEYARKGQALLVLREQMNEAEDDIERLSRSLASAGPARQGEIKAAIRKIESKLRGMQRKHDSLENRVRDLDVFIFGQPVNA